MRALVSLILICLSLGNVIAATLEHPQNLKNAITMLNRELDRWSYYKGLRQSRLDSLKMVLNQASRVDSMRIIEQIAYGYDSYSVDSCVAYFQLGADVAARAGDLAARQRMDFNRYSRLPLLGIAREGVDGFSLLRDSILPENRMSFFEAGNRMMLYTADLYPPSRIRDNYIRASVQLGDSLIMRLAPDSPLRMLLEAQKAQVEGDYATLVAHLSELVDTLSFEDNIFARAASHFGQYYQDTGHSEDAAYYYALASISDIRTGTLEGVALLRLGSLLYDMGDTGHAFRYLNEALEAAAESGSKIRSLEAVQSLPEVSRAFSFEDRKRFILVSVLAGCLLIALGVIIAVLIRNRKQMQRMKHLQHILSEENIAKEKNIARFIELASLYGDKLEELTMLASRKIMAGQIEEFHHMLKEGQVAQSRTKMFCQLFDNAFLHLHPSFVADVNALLQPDKQVIVEGENQLNAELRILAFMRLGVEDSTRVSKFLGMSLNTIYTYRNRMRSRAINRDSFEADVMNIGVYNPG